MTYIRFKQKDTYWQKEQKKITKLVKLSHTKLKLLSKFQESLII